jgi:hypothetical protein
MNQAFEQEKLKKKKNRRRRKKKKNIPLHGAVKSAAGMNGNYASTCFTSRNPLTLMKPKRRKL